MTCFFGYDYPFYNSNQLTIGDGANQILLFDKREKQFPVFLRYSDYCAAKNQEAPAWAQNCPLVWTKHDTIKYDSGLALVDAKAENYEIITFVISSHGHYARSGGGGVNGQIAILRRYPVQEYRNAKKNLESVNHIEIVHTGYALSCYGQAVFSTVAVLRVSRHTDALIRITRSGYPARFGQGAKSQVWFLVVTGGEFYAVPDDEISAFFGGELPWKTHGREEFHII